MSILSVTRDVHLKFNKVKNLEIAFGSHFHRYNFMYNALCHENISYLSANAY
jgi:hypothetical protein